MNRVVLDALRERCEVRTGDVSAEGFQRTLSYDLRRIYKVLQAVFIVIISAGGRPRIYLSAESDWGLVYTLVLTMAARVTADASFFTLS